MDQHSEPGKDVSSENTTNEIQKSVENQQSNALKKDEDIKTKNEIKSDQIED